MNKRKTLRRVITVVVVLAIFLLLRACKEGPIGPPMFTDQKGGEVIINAPLWSISGDVTQHAHRACLAQYFNAQAVDVQAYGPRYLDLGGGVRLPIKPGWITIRCSP